jgi:hypothetical protein
MEKIIAITLLIGTIIALYFLVRKKRKPITKDYLQIIKLIEEKRYEDAEVSISLFKHAYPDSVLSYDLEYGLHWVKEEFDDCIKSLEDAMSCYSRNRVNDKELLARLHFQMAWTTYTVNDIDKCTINIYLAVAMDPKKIYVTFLTNLRKEIEN